MLRMPALWHWLVCSSSFLEVVVNLQPNRNFGKIFAENRRELMIVSLSTTTKLKKCQKTWKKDILFFFSATGVRPKRTSTVVCRNKPFSFKFAIATAKTYSSFSCTVVRSFMRVGTRGFPRFRDFGIIFERMCPTMFLSPSSDRSLSDFAFLMMFFLVFVA